MRMLLKYFCFFVLWYFCQSSYAMLNIELTRYADDAIPIAIVPFAEPKTLQNTAQDVSQVITHDLKNSGRFRILAKDKLPAHPHRVADVDWPTWRGAKVNELIVGQVRAEGRNRYLVQVSLLNLFAAAKQRVLFSQHFDSNKNDLRYLAHHISDVIYQKLLGVPGYFSTQIAYVTVRRHDNKSTDYILEVADADGYNAEPLLTSYQPIMSPAWSPNGKRLAYVSFENREAQIFVQNVATGQRQKVSAFPGINGAPAWSPDGQKLALVLSKTGSAKIYILNLQTHQLTQLTHGHAIDTEPDWAPDGQSIIFTSSRGGGPQIYQKNLASGYVQRLTFSGRYNARARYTPDGSSIIMLHRDQNGQYDIALQNLQSGAMVLLTKAGLNESPSVGPNGKMILYARSQGQYNTLAMVSTDARVRLQLPGRHEDVQGPAWSATTTYS